VPAGEPPLRLHFIRGVKLTTNLRLVQRSRMCRAIPPLSNTPHGVVLS